MKLKKIILLTTFTSVTTLSVVSCSSPEDEQFEKYFDKLFADSKHLITSEQKEAMREAFKISLKDPEFKKGVDVLLNNTINNNLLNIQQQTQEETNYKNAHKTVLDKNVDNISIADAPKVRSAINEYSNLSKEVKTKLQPQKNHLDSLLKEIVSLENRQINNFRNIHNVILNKTVSNVSLADEARLNSALSDYQSLSNNVKNKLDYYYNILLNLQDTITDLKRVEQNQKNINTKVNNYKNAHAEVLRKNTNNITIDDETKVKNAVNAYYSLDRETKSNLQAEINLLDNLNKKIISLKQANQGSQQSDKNPEPNNPNTDTQTPSYENSNYTSDENNILGFDTLDVEQHRLDYFSLQNYQKNWSIQNIKYELESNGYRSLIGNVDGISATKYKTIKQVDNQYQYAIIIEIDVSQQNAYQNAKAFISKLNNDPKYKVTGYRIKNIGKSNRNQNMDEIFDALPDKLPLLELFFASTNTNVMKKLKDKEIKELNFYTEPGLNTGSNIENWSINPLVLTKVKNLNLNDNTNKTRSYDVIKFDNLSFDEEDVYIAGEFDLYKVNKALKMFYWTRNNEKFFQGLNRTYSLKDNNSRNFVASWPLGLDFSNVPSIKNLAGLELKDRNGNERNLNKIKLYNNQSIWTISTQDMNKGQFSDILVGDNFNNVPTKITFSNAKATKEIRIVVEKPNNYERLNYNGIAELRNLLKYNEGIFDEYSVIIVQEGETSLFQSIKDAGFNARYEKEQDKKIPYNTKSK